MSIHSEDMRVRRALSDSSEIGKPMTAPIPALAPLIRPILDTKFYRTQDNKTLLDLFQKNNQLEKKDFILSQDYVNSIKIVIYTPPLDIACGGIMVLHNLAKTINNFRSDNIKVYLYSYDHKRYSNDFCNNFINPFLIDDNTIVIYPENIVGNPLNAKHVVGWILLDLGYEAPKDFYKYAWSPTDIVYNWEPSFLTNSKRLVNIWTNPIIKNQQIKKRDNNCYAFKKMQWIPKTLNNRKIENYHNDKDINIDKTSISEAVDIFNNSELFYCYDPNTFFSVMAPLCGCVTVLHPSNDLTKQEYIRSRILGHPSGFAYDAGIAYSNDPSEIEKAKETVAESWNQYYTLCHLYQSTVSDFIKDMLDKINNKELTNTVKNLYYNGDGTSVGGDFVGPSPYDRRASLGSVVAINSGCVPKQSIKQREK